VRLGSDDALLAREVHLSGVHLAEGVTLPARVRARIRYRHEGEPARVEPAGDEAHGARLVFDAPVRAATRGQIAVLYDDADRVLGGGRIEAVGPCSPSAKAASC
jgi:tRNA-specific 2-thiouridylase